MTGRPPAARSSRGASGASGASGAALALLVLLACGGPARGPEGAARHDILLVTLDTLRADHVGSYGARDAETPALDRLASQGVRFATAVAPSPLTLPSHATILTGLLPDRHGLHQNGTGALPASVATLATRARAAGYRTAAFVGAFVLDRRFGLARGFEVYDGVAGTDPARERTLEAERPGAEVVDRALAWLSAIPPSAASASGAVSGSPASGHSDHTPILLWVHLYDAHAPYAPPSPYAERHAGRPYAGEVAAVDAQVGRLLAALDATGRAARTLVVVAGDHGESLGEHGEAQHGLLLHEAALRVPLLLRAPGALGGGVVVKTPVGLEDLLPTIAGLVTLPPAEGAIDGRDLSPSLLAGEEPPLRDLFLETDYPRLFGWSGLRAVRRGSLKLIVGSRGELFDLGRDPGELTDVGATSPLAAPLREALEARASAVPSGPASLDAPDAEARERLASLGYVGGVAAPSAPGATLRDPRDATGHFRALEEATETLRSGDARAAAVSLRALAAADPPNPVFRARLAKALGAAGERASAIEALRETVALSPQDPEPRHDLGVALADSGEFGGAIEALQEAVRLDPNRPEFRNALGIAYSRADKLNDARNELDRAAVLDADNPRIENNRGNLFRQMGEFAEAERAYRRALELAPGYADAWNGLGALEVARDRPRVALPYLDRALTLDPRLHEARMNRGIALETSGDRAGARSAYLDFLARAADAPELSEQRNLARRLAARLQATGPRAGAPEVKNGSTTTSR